jgi:hypothetical protein
MLNLHSIVANIIIILLSLKASSPIILYQSCFKTKKCFYLLLGLILIHKLRLVLSKVCYHPLNWKHLAVTVILELFYFTYLYCSKDWLYIFLVPTLFWNIIRLLFNQLATVHTACSYFNHLLKVLTLLTLC